MKTVALFFFLLVAAGYGQTLTQYPPSAGGSGTITGVTAGSGLSGGGTSGTVTITGTVPCVSTPGNTTGKYLQPCQAASGAVYACNNAAGCSVAADWLLIGAYDLQASFGAACDGVTDDSVAMAAAIASGHSIWVRDGVTCTFGTALTWTSQQIWFSNGTNRATLKYTGSGTGFTMNGGQNYKIASGFKNITLSGPPLPNSTSGLLLGGTAGAFGFVCDGCYITNFGNVALMFGSNTWMTNIKDSVFQNNGQDIQYPASVTTNSGEDILFDHDLFTNAQSGFAANSIYVPGQPQGAMIFQNCSMDNIGAYFANGVIKILGGHVEVNPGLTATSSLLKFAGGVGLVSGVDFLFDDNNLSAFNSSVLGYISVSGGNVTVSNVDPTNFTYLPNLALVAVSGSGSVDVGSISAIPNGGISQLVVGTTTGLVTQVQPSAVGVPPIVGTSPPPASVTAKCTSSCTTTYSYVAVPKQWDGSNAAASTAVSITNGAATLSNTNYNTIAPGTCLAGTFSVDYYRQVNAGTQQFVGNGNCSSNFVDLSLNPVTATAPTNNTTGKSVSNSLTGIGPAPTISNTTGTVTIGLTATQSFGTITSGTTGSVAFTFTFGTAQPHRWVCQMRDETTNADVVGSVQSPAPTTTALSFAGTTVTGDVISYSCGGN